MHVAGPQLTDIVHRRDLVLLGLQQRLQVAEDGDDLVHQEHLDPGDASEHPVAAGDDPLAQGFLRGGQPQDPGHVRRLEQLRVRQFIEGFQRLRDGLVGGRPGGDQVVAQQHLDLAVVVTAEFGQLQVQLPAAGPQFEDVLVDVQGRPLDQQLPLQHVHRVGDGGVVVDLGDEQPLVRDVETRAVALQGRDRLVGAGEDDLRLHEHAPDPLHVEGDHVHRLADRHHRAAGLQGGALRAAVPGPGL